MKRGLPLMALHRLTLGLQKTARHPLSRLHARVRVVRARKVSGAAAVPPMQTNGGSRRFKYLCARRMPRGSAFLSNPGEQAGLGSSERRPELENAATRKPEGRCEGPLCAELHAQ